MSNRPIHQNLDTSFVNLSSLVTYLKKRQFAGSIRVRLNGYSAEILVKENSRLEVREHDLISGRVSEGAEAFKRVLIRAREPGGTIDVYQNLKNKKPARPKVAAKPVPLKAIPKEAKKEIPIPPPIVEVSGFNGSKLPVSKSKNGRNGNGHRDLGLDNKIEFPEIKPKKIEEEAVNPGLQTAIPDFPFELSNSVEKKARRIGLSNEDWQLLLKLTVEILGVVDRSLSSHGLDFAAGFRKARAEIVDDYPFMNPESGIFDYEDRRITMTKQVGNAIFVRSIIDSLSRIFDRLAENPKFDDLYRDTAQLIITLIEKRGQHYDRFGITPPLRKIIGI